MRGLGGAGARGYLVNPSEDAGDVGDLRFAAVTICCDFSSVPTDPVVVSRSFFTFRRRAESLLLSFIRIDRLAGVMSSEGDVALALDLDSRGCMLVFDLRSMSESEDETDTVSIVRLFSLSAKVLERVTLFVRSDLSAGLRGSDDPERPMARVVEVFPLRFALLRRILRAGSKGEKCPSLSRKHATK